LMPVTAKSHLSAAVSLKRFGEAGRRWRQQRQMASSEHRYAAPAVRRQPQESSRVTPSRKQGRHGICSNAQEVPAKAAVRRSAVTQRVSAFSRKYNAGERWRGRMVKATSTNEPPSVWCAENMSLLMRQAGIIGGAAAAESSRVSSPLIRFMPAAPVRSAVPRRCAKKAFRSGR